MNIIRYAATIDLILQRRGIYRSKLSIIARAVQDQLIQDHFKAKSDPTEAAQIILTNLIELGR